MKILAFSLIYLSISASLFGYKFPWRLAFWVSILYVFLLRQGGFQGDFQVYLEELRSGWLSVYYLREPLFWVGSKLLFSYLGSERVVIFFYDFLFCFVLYKAVKKVSDVNVFFILLISFPVFLGLENVYRQVLGFPFSFLFIFYCVRARLLYSVFYLLLASLFHNSYIVLAPMLVFCIPRISIGIRLLVVLLSFGCAAIFMMYWGFSVDMIEKSSAQSTGLNLEFLYAIIIFLLSSFSVPFFLKRFSDKWILASVIINLMYFISMTLLGSSQSERIGMILLLALFYLYFCLADSTLKRRDYIMKLQMFFILAIPVFLFSSTRGFLISGGY